MRSDGTTGLSASKMASNEAKATVDTYLTCIRLLTLQARTKSNEIIVLWKNPRSRSTRFIRPAKFEFVKEPVSVISSKK